MIDLVILIFVLVFGVGMGIDIENLIDRLERLEKLLTGEK